MLDHIIEPNHKYQHNLPMQFLVSLTSIALVGVLTFSPSLSAKAQNTDTTRLDDAVLDMAQASKIRDRKRMAQLLPTLRGHPLEPWAAYWELSNRLDEAGPTEIQDFLTRYSGSYQEDRLRANWLAQLGRNREWVAFNREYPLYRMNDDRSLRCYALLAEHLSSGADNTTQVKEAWLIQIFFAHGIENKDIEKLFEKRIEDIRKYLAQCEVAQANIDENYKRVGIKRLRDLWQLTLDYGEDHYENEIAWLKKTLPKVRKLPKLEIPKE